MRGYQLVISVVFFGAPWWMGLYVLGRARGKPVLRFVSLGLLSYALALALQILLGYTEAGSGAELLGRLLRGMIVLPAFCWAGALIELVVQARPQPGWLARAWRFGGVPALVLALLGALALPQGAGVVLALVPLVASYGLVLRNLRLLRPAGARGLLVAATLFFVLALALLVLPRDWLQDSWLLLGMGVDLLLLGYSIAALDAFDEGERLHPDLRRSLLASALAAGIFGGQVAVALAVLGPSVALVGLLIATVASAIASQVLSAPLQRLLDRAAFAGMPALQEARAELRAVETVLPRISAAVDAIALDEAEFTRLIRRALSVPNKTRCGIIGLWQNS